MDNIAVSVSCLVYNHEKYLRKTLDGFINQKTNFKYEILVHDDASTDSSPEIIREYEQKYPDIIKPIYQSENQYSRGVVITHKYQYPRAKGKYIAFCEGDDYWCDCGKLQKQYDIMEKYPNCSICVHKVQVVEEYGEKRDVILPQADVEEGMYSPQKQIEFLSEKDGKYIFQLSSFFLRKEYIMEGLDDQIKILYKWLTGDRALLLYYATKGDLYYIDKIMSCYRWMSVGSWTVRMFKNKKNILRNLSNLIQGYKSFDEYTQYQFHDSLDEFIKKNETILYYMEEKYIKVFDKAHRKYWKMMSAKQRIVCILGSIAPHVVRFYFKRKEK